MNCSNRSFARLLSFFCALAIVMTAGGSAMAGTRTHRSDGVAQFTSATTFIGSGHGTHLGHYTEAGSVAFTPTGNPMVVQVTGSTDYTAANGDVLHAVVSGTLNFLTGAINATLTFDGGTGRFDDATGSATLTGQLGPNGSITASVRGSIDF